MVDSNDRERVQESADELQKMVNAQLWEPSPLPFGQNPRGGMEIPYTKGRGFSFVALDKYYFTYFRQDFLCKSFPLSI